MSSFQPVRIVKGRIGSDKLGRRFRNGLVVVQFAISIMLMIGTGSIYNQVRFMKNKKLGFDKEQILYLPIRETRIQDSAIAFKEEVKRFHGIAQAALSNLLPVGLASSDAFIPEGYAEGTSAIMSSMAVDAEYIPTMGMEIVIGRNFSADIVTDLKNAAILNETAVRQLGWTDPIGKKIQHLVGSGLNEKIQKTVVGVVKDFHYNTLHRAIDPMYISNDVSYSGARFLMVRIQGGQIEPTLEFLRAAWEKIEPERPFRFRFLSDSLNRMYAAEEKLSAIFILFTGFAIVIACLGLFGLASFASAQRTKEVGIRKSLGASMGSVVLMLIMDFTKWVVIANVIAWPAIYFILRTWLQNFNYRSPIRWEIFVLASGLALFIAVLTVSAQSIKAALTNPARSLRYE